MTQKGESLILTFQAIVASILGAMSVRVQDPVVLRPVAKSSLPLGQEAEGSPEPVRAPWTVNCAQFKIAQS